MWPFTAHKRTPVEKANRRAWLFDVLPPLSAGAEVGVYKGAFTAQLIKGLQPHRLYLIDPWRYEPDPMYAKAWYGGKAGGKQAEMDAIYDEVVRNFGSHPAVVILRASSHEASARIPDRSLDFVYIDGNHLYEFVRDDLVDYAPKVKLSGIIAGDDYREGGWWRGGVKKAVDEFVKRGGVEVIKIHEGQFLLRRG